MADNLSKDKRSRVMASIKGKNTRPELLVRKMLWTSGIRYRTHDGTIFGRPDISNKKRKVAVFIDGCFWHGCSQCYKEPTSNVEYWKEKICRNKDRRRKVMSELGAKNWHVLEFWEHEVLADPRSVARQISGAFRSP